MWEVTGFSTRAVVIAVRCAGPGKQLEVAGCCPQQRSAWPSDREVIIAPQDPVRSWQRKTRFCSRRYSCPITGGTPSPGCPLFWRIDPRGWSHLNCGRSHPPPLPSVWRWCKPLSLQGRTSITQTQGSCGVRVVPLQPLALSPSPALSNPLDHGPKPSPDSTSGKLTRGPDWGHGGAGLRPLEQRRDSGPSSRWWDPRAAKATGQRSSASSKLPSGQQVQNAGGVQISQHPGQWPMDHGAPGHDAGAANEEKVHVYNHTGSKMGEEKAEVSYLTGAPGTVPEPNQFFYQNHGCRQGQVLKKEAPSGRVLRKGSPGPPSEELETIYWGDCLREKAAEGGR